MRKIPCRTLNGWTARHFAHFLAFARLFRVGCLTQAMTTLTAEKANLLRAARRHQGFLQKTLAAAVGCSQSYIAQCETGRRPISAKYARALEAVLGLEPYELDCEQKPGRPPMNDPGRQSYYTIRKARGESKEKPSPLPRPHYPRVDTAKPRDDAFQHLSDDRVLQALERAHPNDEGYWKRTNMVRADSNPERFFLIRVFWQSCMVVCASFRSLGCSLHSANGLTGRNTDHLAYPTYLLWHEGMAVAVMPQRCVRTAVGYRWPDVTLVLAKNGRKVTIVIEINGPTHTNPHLERRRDEELGVKVYHVPIEWVEKPGLLEYILDDAARLLAN